MGISLIPRHTTHHYKYFPCQFWTQLPCILKYSYLTWLILKSDCKKMIIEGNVLKSGIAIINGRTFITNPATDYSGYSDPIS